MAKQRKANVSEPVPLRPGAKWLEGVCGPAVLFYDKGNRAVLEDTRLGELGEGIFWDDDAMEELSKTGLALAWTVHQYEKGEQLQAQWYIGPPRASELRSKSLKPLNQEPMNGRLYLPTGRVRIEGYDAVSIGPGPGILQKGSELRIPPGIYEVSLHEAPLGEGEVDHRGLFFFLTFTPLKRVPSKPVARGNRSSRKGR